MSIDTIETRSVMDRSMTHPMPDGGIDPAEMAALALVLLGATFYAAGVLRMHRRGDRWPSSRSACAAAGFGCLAATLLPPLATDLSFAMHAVRHLLAMAAPFALALSAPITLALRTLGPRSRRTVLLMLRSPWTRAVNTAPVVLILDVGGMFAFYLTPLYSAAHQHRELAAAVHLHMFLAGCLLSWYLVGRDPMPSRASTRTRLLVLFLAAGGHNLLAKLVYAQGLPEPGGTVEDVHLGAQIMFYGGDVMELALAGALLSAWYARTGRQLRRNERGAETAGPGNTTAGPSDVGHTYGSRSATTAKWSEG